MRFQPLLLLILSGLITTSGYGAERIALVIGNSAYQHERLSNPQHDARDMARLLEEKLGFAVTFEENLTRRQMAEVFAKFTEKLNPQSVGLFYYAGHGNEINGFNYMIPLQAQIHSEADVEYEAIAVQRLLKQMQTAGNQLNIIIVDACRNNPFSRSFRRSKQSRGLIRMNAPLGSIIASSTASGKIASDGAYGRNSPYTKHLLDWMQKPGLTIEQVFKRVRQNVVKDTQRQQIPWESSSLMGDFYFVPITELIPSPIEDAVNPNKTSPTVKPTPENAYNQALEQLRAGQYQQAAASFQAFVDNYPSSNLAGNAYHWMGEAHYVNRAFEKAKQAFLTLGAQYPNSEKLPDTLLKLGYVYSELGETERARKVLGKLIEAFPESYAANLAEKHLRLQTDTDKHAYNQALEQLRAGQYQQAAASFQAFVDNYPSSNLAGNAYHWMGEAHYVNRAFEKAKRAFLTLGAQYPNSEKLPDTLLKLGYVYSELGETERARKVLGKLIEAFPESYAANVAEKHLRLMR